MDGEREKSQVGRDLRGRRLFTPIFLVRRWQIEKNAHEHEGELEEHLVTVERLRELRGLVATCFPGGRVTWSLSRGALLTRSPHWERVRDVLGGFADEYGDALVPNPCAGYTILYNSCEDVQAELRELFDAVGEWRGETPRAVQAWVLLSRNIAALHEEYGLDAVSGHCFSQYGVDHMSMEGSVSYPYYPSRRHVLVPGRDAEDLLPVPMLDVISLDLVTARLPRKKARRLRRMGLQLLETVNYDKVGPEAGLHALRWVTRTYLTDNRPNLPFAWITSTQEVIEAFRHDFSFPTYREWWSWLAEEYPDLEVCTTAELGRDFRATYADNCWRYHLHARGSGVGVSDPETSIDWIFCKDYRQAVLHEPRRGKRRPRLIDFVDYGQQATEPDGPCADISLHASPWQKRS